MVRQYDEVIEGKIYVGNAEEAECAITDLKVNHVYDVRVNGRDEQVSYDYTHRPIEENNEAETIKKGAEEIAATIRNGNSVYIHCGSGTGRAAVMAAATLMELGEVPTLEEAMNTVLQKRKGARFQPIMVNALEKIYK